MCMLENTAQWAYETMVCHVQESYRMPGVEDAFAAGSYCMGRYKDAMDAYERLCDRLGVADEDADVEIMRNALEDIQRELCMRMYRYGMRWGKEHPGEA